MRIVRIVVIIAILSAAGYALWTLREPIGSLWKSAHFSASSEPSVQFVVVGDNHGVNPVYRQILTEIAKKKYAFLLNLADTSDQGSQEEFAAVRDLEKTLPFPVYHVLGSHDIKTDPTGAGFRQVFNQPTTGAFDIGRIHLILLNNADRKIGFPESDLRFLKSDLAAHPDTVNLIAYHRPFGLPLASILGDDETAASRATDTDFEDIISTAHVSYIFTAHLHTYLPYALQGIPAAVSGGGGADAQIVLGGSKNNFFHYLVVTVKGNTVSIVVHRVQLNDTISEQSPPP